MAKRQNQQPTEKELEILRILWESGPSTVREVNEEMNKQQRTGYTTTLKLMQIMTEKGLVVRDDSRFQHVYEPAVTEEKTQSRVVRDLLEKRNSRVRRVLPTLKEALWETRFREPLRFLDKAIFAIDFKKALSILLEIADELGIPLEGAASDAEDRQS